MTKERRIWKNALSRAWDLESGSLGLNHCPTRGQILSTSLSLSFFICQMGITGAALQGGFEGCIGQWT